MHGELTINHRLLFPVLSLAGLLLSELVLAQGGRLGAGVDVVMPGARFENAPKLGEMVPDLTIVDDQGNPANLKGLTSGQYTVLTLGCLT